MAPCPGSARGQHRLASVRGDGVFGIFHSRSALRTAEKVKVTEFYGELLTNRLRGPIIQTTISESPKLMRQRKISKALCRERGMVEAPQEKLKNMDC